MSDENTSSTSVVDDTHGAESRRTPRTHVHITLARLTAGQLRSIGEALSVPTSGSVNDLRLVIEGKITDLGRNPRNVQVALSRDKDDATLTLSDHEGVFLTVNPGSEGDDGHSVEDRSNRGSRSPEPIEANELEAIRNERDELRATVDVLTQEKAELQEQLQALQQALETSKARVKDIWKMSCEQVEEFEETNIDKDREIAELKLRLAAQPRNRSHSPTPSIDSSVELPVAAARQPRRGRAPPVEMFSGENSGVRLDDWLPSLRRAANWNDWTEEEQLIQFAGHLKGRALAEWNLLSPEEIRTVEVAAKSMRERLDPCSKVMAGQDFRRTMQRDGEAVSDFICRLEKAYSIAYGTDKMTKETKDVMLYGQLQEGLRLSIVKSPSVSGALSYRELCMAAKHEEKRLAEVKKRQDNEKTSPTNRYRSDRPNSGAGASRGSNGNNSQTGSKDVRRCYLCNKMGHVAKYCKTANKEKEASGSLSKCDEKAKYSQPTSKAHVANKQVRTVTPRAMQVKPSGSGVSVDPVSLLYSSDSEGSVDMVRVDDQGSRPQYVNITIQGVPTSGVIDTGADITIMGGELFKKIAKAAKLKKKNFKQPDRTPCTYDRNQFKLHGRMDLEISFDGKMLVTPIYIKMDAHDQLLLSEGVCSQLGILEYHKNVWPGRELVTDVTSGETAVTLVRTYRVSLSEPVIIPANKTTVVPVHVESNTDINSVPLLLEGNGAASKETGLIIERALLQPGGGGAACVKIHNVGGFTERIEEGAFLGDAEETYVVIPPEEHCNVSGEVKQIGVDTDLEDHGRRTKLIELITVPDLPDPDKTLLTEFLMDHHDVFALDESDRGETDLIQLEIDTGEAPPIKQSFRRMPYAAREEVANQLHKMRKMNVVQPSKSPWASPVVLVKKKNGSFRFCVDYRSLNTVTKSDNFPLPRIDDLLDELGKAKFFSTLDLASGFWQIRVRDDSQEKTAFSTPFGLFEFRVMPFGLKNAPSVFQRLMQQVLSGVNPENGPSFVAAYIDDLLIFSVSLQEHLDHLRKVIHRLREVGLKVNPAKCQFIRREVEYLGHIITPEGLKPNSKLVEAVRDYSPPKTVQQLRRFLGLTSYYRRFINQFAKVAAPLHLLTCKNVAFKWSQECQSAFEELKKRLVTPPVLSYPNFDEDFVLETDASHQGLGAVLSQRQEDGKLHPIAYASRALSGAEKNYGITDLETLAVVWEISHFHYYLYGHRVTVYTDHSAVKAVLETASPTGRHARWWTRVFSRGVREVAIVYRPGKDNVLADALSRNPTGSAPMNGVAEEESQVAVVQSAATTIGDMLKRTPAVGCKCDLADEQRKDSEVKPMLEYLESDVLPEDQKAAGSIVAQAPSYCVLDGVLYFIDGRRGKRVVVPRSLKSLIMAENHSGPCAGHFAGNKLYNMLVRHWYWKGMYEDVMSHCRNCPQCVFVSGSGRHVKPPLHPIPVNRPFQVLGVDIMDLPITESGNKHVVVFQDYFSKWPLVYAVRDQKAITLVELLTKEVIPLFGVPEALLSDRGTNLLSHLMSDVCAHLGIAKLNTTAYHPECDGMVERFNRTLKAMLRKHVGRFGTQWDWYLSGVLWAYRNTPHDTTGEKPSYLLFGMDLRSPTEAELTSPSELNPISVTDYREELFISLSSARQLAVESIQESQRKYKEYYDRKTKADRFRLGEWVLIKFPHEESGKQRKLSRPWHGPYRIMKLTDTDVTAIKIYFPEDGTIKVHQSRVSPCPLQFPAGCYWYGESHKCASLPKWAASLFQEQTQKSDTTTTDQKSSNTMEQTRNDAAKSDVTEQTKSDSTRQATDSGEPLLLANTKSPTVNNRLSRSRATTASASSDVPLPVSKKTRTRNIMLPVRYRDQPRCADN